LLIRKKFQSAVVIQTAWRKFVARKKQRAHGQQTLSMSVGKPMQPSAKATQPKVKSRSVPRQSSPTVAQPIAQSVVIDDFKKQVAALTIQLAWRQFVRRQAEIRAEDIQRQLQSQIVSVPK
jgi:hypothetical protein